MTTPSTLRRTPLHAAHVAAGARLVDFAGWDMPVQYAGVIEEHLAVRQKAGLFDVSHMGEIEVRGPRALEVVQELTCNDASRLTDGRAQYSAILTPRGTPVDDILVYRLAADRFLLCVNASNDDKDFEWIREHARGRAEVLHVSAEYAQIALQGPLAAEILAGVTPAAVAGLASFAFTAGRVAGHESLIARTGYTGEDGFEIYCNPVAAPSVWEALMEAGKPRGLEPAGLGARDTLRLEASLALYGNDIDETTTLLEAGLDFIVRLDKGSFIGREALLAQKQNGVPRKLTGFEMLGRGIARHGYPVEVAGQSAGAVCSGTYAPFLRKNIGMVYLPIEHAQEGREFDITIRAKPVRAHAVKMPFYRRARRPAR